MKLKIITITILFVFLHSNFSFCSLDYQQQDSTLRPMAARRDKEATLNPLMKALIDFGRRYVRLGGDPDKFIHYMTVARLLLLEDPVGILDSLPTQKKITESGKPLQFGPGILYSGRKGFKTAVFRGRLPKGVELTRVPQLWADDVYSKKVKNPAIFAIRTEVFNRYLQNGKARLKIHGTDPYPQIDIQLPLDEAWEIWISEDTYDECQRLMAEKPKTRYARTLQNNLKALFKVNKIKVISGLRHLRIDREIDVAPKQFQFLWVYIYLKGGFFLKCQFLK